MQKTLRIIHNIWANVLRNSQCYTAIHNGAYKGHGETRCTVIMLNQVCHYIILRLASGGVNLNVLKLHKLLYYVQAWSLAYGNGRVFEEDFQAWVHGPVSRQIFDRFSTTKNIYSQIGIADLQDGFDAESVSYTHLTLPTNREV